REFLRARMRDKRRRIVGCSRGADLLRANSSEKISRRRQTQWLGSFLGGVWSSAAVKCYAHVGSVRKGGLIKAGAAARSVSTSNAGVPTASISAEPWSLFQLSGQAISSTARGRLACTSAALQAPRSATNWR